MNNALKYDILTYYTNEIENILPILTVLKIKDLKCQITKS